MIDTQLQYYLGIKCPEELPDEIWAQKFEMLREIRKQESENNHPGLGGGS